MTVVEALAKLESKADSWPVIRLDGVNDDELQGLVTVRQLREAVESGHSDRKLGEVIHSTDDKDPAHLRHFPHVHMDHSLDTAQRRMANGRTNVLPVINRTNIRRITGVLLMEDIQRAYGIELSEPKPEPEQGRLPAGMTLLRMVAVTLGVLILIGLVTRTYQNDRIKRAATAYQAGIALVAQGSTDDAIERFRTALSTTPNNKEYRLALGSALVQGEHFDEASLYLNGILKSDPENGPANLEMARVMAKQGTLAQTSAAYHKAIFGVWPKGREQERQEAVLELADYLFAHGAQAEAALELVGLARQNQTTLAMKERAAEKLLSFHEPGQALAVFREIVATNPHDGNAWAGLGEAQFALGDYPSAEVSLQNGATWGSGDQNVAAHLKITQDILSMDPWVRGESVAERYHRSVNLLRHMLDLVEMCKPPLANAPDLSRLVARASQQLKQDRSQNTETAGANVSMAEDLWVANQKWCGTSPDPALALVMPLLTK
jgi:tetratricopeptide (TPR) repeat protein